MNDWLRLNIKPDLSAIIPQTIMYFETNNRVWYWFDKKNNLFSIITDDLVSSGNSVQNGISKQGILLSTRFDFLKKKMYTLSPTDNNWVCIGDDAKSANLKDNLWSSYDKISNNWVYPLFSTSFFKNELNSYFFKVFDSISEKVYTFSLVNRNTFKYLPKVDDFSLFIVDMSNKKLFFKYNPNSMVMELGSIFLIKNKYFLLPSNLKKPINTFFKNILKKDQNIYDTNTNNSTVSFSPWSIFTHNYFIKKFKPTSTFKSSDTYVVDNELDFLFFKNLYIGKTTNMLPIKNYLKKNSQILEYIKNFNNKKYKKKIISKLNKFYFKINYKKNLEQILHFFVKRQKFRTLLFKNSYIKPKYKLEEAVKRVLVIWYNKYFRRQLHVFKKKNYLSFFLKM